jgi:hypothetical protein
MGFIMVIFQVSSVFVDKARWGTVYPKEVPYLQRIQPKDPISLETLGHVRTPTTFCFLPNICKEGFHGVVHEGALLPTLLCSLQRYYPNITII